MPTFIDLRLFGPPEISVNGSPLIANLPQKSLALLYYLAVTPKAVERELLADLLWPEHRTRNARQSLRNALLTLRGPLGDFLEITQQSVGLRADRIGRVDVLDFAQGLAGIEKSQHSAAQVDLAHWQAILELYRGDFLAGFHILKARPFEEWATLQREHLHQQAVAHLRRLAEAYAANSQTEAGIALLNRLLALEPWDEAAYAQQIGWLVALGRRTEALRQYELCCQMLQEQFGLPPSAELVALHAKISQPRQPVPSLPPQDPPIPTNLTQPLWHFVGREGEMATLLRRIAEPHGRLLTVIGTGGVGKTTLAQEVGLRLLKTQPSAFPDGIFLVPLADIQAEGQRGAVNGYARTENSGEGVAEEMAATLAKAIGCTLQGGISATVQLRAYLQPRHTLLILDNFEHLLDATEAILALLTQAPGLRLLITSRVRLNVQGESVIYLDNLSLPVPSDPLAHAAAEDGPDPRLAESEAVTLFVQRVCGHDPDFSLNPHNQAAVDQICHLVDGLPLALVLAATLAPLMGCANLAAALAQSLRILENDIRDLPQRQRSLTAIFEHSWALLTEDAQMLLTKLALFPGSFSRQAAETVAGATIPQLITLLNHSLLSRAGEDRYLIHRVIREFASQKLQERPDLIGPLQQRFAHYFLSAIGQKVPSFLPADYAAKEAFFLAEKENVRYAWHLAADQQMVAELDQSMHMLLLVYEHQVVSAKARTQFAEIYGSFTYALQKFAPQRRTQLAAQGQVIRLLVGRLYNYVGWMAQRMGRTQEAEEAYRVSLPLLQEADHPFYAAFCLTTMASFWRVTDLNQSKALLEQALGLIAETDALAHTFALFTLGEVEYLRGDYPAALAHLAIARELCKQTGWKWGLAICSRQVGVAHLLQGDYATAESYLRETIDLAHAQRLTLVWIESLLNLAQALGLQGRLDEAQSYLSEGRQWAEAYEIDFFIGLGCWAQGCLAEQRGDFQSARRLLRQGLAAGHPNKMRDLLPTLGWVLIGLGEVEQARAYFQEKVEQAERQKASPVSLEAQAGLAYIQAQSGGADAPETIAKSLCALRHIRQGRETAAETRQRIDRLLGEL